VKVFIITKEPFPKGMASTHRITDYAKGLNINNVDCEVIIAKRTEFPWKEIRNNESSGIFEGVKFRYIPNTVFRHKNRFVRILNDYIDYIRTFLFCIKHLKKGDIVINMFLAQVLALYTIFAAKLKGASIIRELNEYPYATRKPGIIRLLKQFIELHFIFHLYDGFIVISTALRDIAQKHKSSGAQIIQVPILANVEMYNQYLLNTKNIEIKEPYIFHPGTLTERKDGILSSLRAFAMAIKKIDFPIKYILAGPVSPIQGAINKIIEESNLQNKVIIYNTLSREDVIWYLKHAALAILNKVDNIQNKCGFSTKLGEILLSETPVITTTVGEAKYWLKDQESAYIVDPHKPELIADKIVQAFLNHEERTMIAKNGKKIAEEMFNHNHQAQRLKLFFETLS